MRLDEPSWWYREPAAGVANCLAPLGALYGWAARARYMRAAPYRSRLPVLCVGNFTTGGTGKTPLVGALCERLRADGQRPVALTRGYGGSFTGPHWVSETDTARDVGDEALLLARAAPTLVARDRQAGARAIERHGADATVVVMDDGLQNPQLAKDLTLAVVDAGRALGNGLVIPAGPLRAPLEFQLELTDAIVVNTPGQQLAASPVADWLRRHFHGPVLRAATVPAADADWLEGARVIAWAGIGAPQRFFAMVAELGAEVVRHVAFGDHQRLSQADAGALLISARRLDATLVTTEKDLARLSSSTGALAELATESRAVPIKLAFDAPDADRLAALLAMTLKTR